MPRTDDEDHSPTGGTSLEEVLEEARHLGFFGPGPIEPQLRHAEGFVEVVRPLYPTAPRLVDMGAGGGLPGLVIAARWPEVTLVLLEASERRSAFLRRSVEELGLAGRVTVLQERAEVSGRDPAWRGTFDGAVARSFGRPAVLAECTAPLLTVGARVVVSEPPPSPLPALPKGGAPAARDEAERWPAHGLRQLGLEPEELVHAAFDYQLLRQVSLCPDRFPRRNGVPAKKPLF